MTLEYTIRPISDRTAFTGPPLTGNRNPFEASWSSTQDLLERELYYLAAKRVVLEMDVAEKDIRLDGTLRANASAASPAVRLAFESCHGPLVYATDRFGWDYSDRPYAQGWQQNVRAIALGLEALRRVDRYGISRRGEQYRGYKAISGAVALPSALSVEEALTILGNETDQTLVGSLLDESRIRATVKSARFATHPDRNDGRRDRYDQVERAVAALEAAGMWAS